MSENNSSRQLSSSDGSLVRRLFTIFREPLKLARRLSSSTFRIVTSCSALYVALIIMAAYAFWDARTPVTMISPFQLAKADLPFNGTIVADALQDALRAIHDEAEGDRLNEKDRPLERTTNSTRRTNTAFSWPRP